MLVGTNGCPQRHWQPASASPARPCQQLRGCPGQPRSCWHGGEGADDGSAGIMPPPGGPGGETGRSSGAGPCIASRPDPVAGINRDTVRAPAADAGRRQARAARHLAGVPGRRLMPAAQPARSSGTPGDDDLDTAAAHPGRRQEAHAARRATASARRPGHRARGHAARRPGDAARTAPGPAAPRAQTPDLAGPPRRRCPGPPTVSRLTGPDRQVVPLRHAGLPSQAGERAWHSRTVWQAPARRGT